MCSFGIKRVYYLQTVIPNTLDYNDINYLVIQTQVLLKIVPTSWSNVSFRLSHSPLPCVYYVSLYSWIAIVYVSGGRKQTNANERDAAPSDSTQQFHCMHKHSVQPRIEGETHLFLLYFHCCVVKPVRVCVMNY